MSVGNHTLPSELLNTCSDGLMYCMSEWASDVTGGLFWVFALLSFCVVLIMATARLGTTRAFGFGSFAGMLGSIWLSIMGLISWWIASLFIIVGVLGIAMMILSER